jgi:hypothetical protein
MGKKTTRKLHQELKTKHIYGNAQKGLDDNIFIQRILNFFQNVSS